MRAVVRALLAESAFHWGPWMTVAVRGFGASPVGLGFGPWLIGGASSPTGTPGPEEDSPAFRPPVDPVGSAPGSPSVLEPGSNGGNGGGSGSGGAASGSGDADGKEDDSDDSGASGAASERVLFYFAAAIIIST